MDTLHQPVLNALRPYGRRWMREVTLIRNEGVTQQQLRAAFEDGEVLLSVRGGQDYYHLPYRAHGTGNTAASVYLTIEEKERLVAKAREFGLNMSNLIRTALEAAGLLEAQ